MLKLFKVGFKETDDNNISLRKTSMRDASHQNFEEEKDQIEDEWIKLDEFLLEPEIPEKPIDSEDTPVSLL
jgi:hypothetical protein